MIINAGLCSRQGGAIPLEGVEVTGEVLGAHARVVVRQRYRNRESRPVEAVYTFPLPADATLAGFAMTCDGRRIEGEVREREAAFRAYDDAIVSGHGAALVEQERANVFTASVGNLLPGEETLVEVEYLQRVQADEGAIRWMIPTLVAPRYIPGTEKGDRTADGVSPPTDRVPDADRITPRAGHVEYGLRLDLLFDLGRDVVVESPSHAVVVTREAGSRVRVAFAQSHVSLDRDVVITARSASEGQLSTLATHRSGTQAGVFALTVIPDLLSVVRDTGRQTVVFVIDTSGSMDGESLPQAKSALRLCLRHLREGDRFNVIEFNSAHREFAREPVPFTQATLNQADRWVNALVANGGTEILQPMLAALRGLSDGVVILLTDGQVGNEDEVMQQVLAVRGRSRIYSFGIGTNVSDALLRDLARKSNGAVEFIHPGERIDEKVVAQFARAVAPRVTDVSVKFHGVDAGELAPAELQPLVDGEPWVLFGRYEASGYGRAEIRGKLRGEAFALEVALDLPASASRPALPKLWASERIRDLEAMAVGGRRADSMRERIVKLATEYGVASKHTSFVVVEKRTGARRSSGEVDTRVIPVNLPAGWRMFDRVAQDQSQGAGMPAAAYSARSRGAMPMAPAPSAMPMATRGPAGGFGSAGMGPPPPPAAFDARSFATGSMPGAPTRQVMEESPADDAGELMSSADAPAPSMLEKAKKFIGAIGKGASKPKPSRADEGSAVDHAVLTSAGETASTLLGRQLASGLWDEPGLSGEDELRSMRATTRALLQLLREQITTTHPMYGAQVRKAVDAVMSRIAMLATTEPAMAQLALGLAWLLASGRRTRTQIETAAGAHTAFDDLRSRLGDERGVREYVDRSAQL